MSEMIGETFVSIVPVVNQAEFASQVESQVASATQQVKVSVPVTPVADQAAEQRVAALRAASAEAAGAVAALQQRLVVGQASTAEAAAALDAYTSAQLQASKAAVELDIALGRESAKEDLALLTRQRLIEQTEILTAVEQRRARSLGGFGGGGGGGGRGPTELRGVIREVASGEAGVSSLLAPAALLRFGAAGLAIGAVVSTLGALQKGLKVTGDEALTTEGRFRNLGAALLTGNLVEGFQALNAQSKDASEQLKELEKALNLKEARTAGQQMQDFADHTQAARDELVKQQKELGNSSSFFDLNTKSTRVLGRATVELLGPVGDLADKYGLTRVAAERLDDGTSALLKEMQRQRDDFDKTGAKAREYANDLKVAEQAVKDLAREQVTAARNASLVSRTQGTSDDLAEARRKEAVAREDLADPNLPLRKDNPKRIAAEAAVVTAHSEVLRLRKQLADERASLQSTIAENRQASEESIASRSTSSKDELTLARKDLAEAQADFDAGAKTAVERSKLNRAVVEAKTRVVKAEQAVAAEEKQAAEEAERVRKERLAAAKREAELRGKALRDALDLREQSLQLALQEARATDTFTARQRPRLTTLPGRNPGLVEEGNIDINNRPSVRNKDGSVSTVRSISIDVDGREVLIPTVVGGKVVSPKEAIAHFFKTHQHLGIFSSAAYANEYAQRLHEEQAALRPTSVADPFADDRKALMALIRFNHEKSQNLRLEKSERIAAAAEEKSLRDDLRTLNREALADALGVKEQNLRNAIEAAKLTDDRGVDDDKANAAFLRFLKQQVANARKLKDGGRALADAKADLIAFQLSLKDAKQAGGFSVQDLFQEAAHEFSAFGSNITPTAEGPLSPQDARGFLAADVLSRAGTAGGGLDLGRLADATLTEAQKQTRLLAAIVAALGGGPGVVPEGAGFRPARESGGVGSLDAINVNQAAAIFGIT